MDSAHKFTGKAELYAQHRPSYPEACINYLIASNRLTDESIVADIGSGTGIFANQLLDRGLRVMAVEPNTDMRITAEKTLGKHGRYTSISGTAEHTGLMDYSVDLVTSAQAFHWFDPVQFRLECQRILKPGARAALIWNSRIHSSEAVAKSAEICRQYCSSFNGFSGGMEEHPESLELFYDNGEYELQKFENHLSFSLDGFIGRNLSASYAPKIGEAAYEPFVHALTELFSQYSKDGQLLMPNETRCYMGSV